MSINLYKRIYLKSKLSLCSESKIEFECEPHNLKNVNSNMTQLTIYWLIKLES